jgi:hypothetical protein
MMARIPPTARIFLRRVEPNAAQGGTRKVGITPAELPDGAPDNSIQLNLVFDSHCLKVRRKLLCVVLGRARINLIVSNFSNCLEPREKLAR